MGISLLKSCYTAPMTCRSGVVVAAPAPNPRPDRWRLLDAWEYPNGYVLRVRYLDATNFEGVKVMVYRGKYRPRRSLDPHFTPDSDSPIARFRPDVEGINMAKNLAAELRSVRVRKGR
jgi:hypothetical protein